MFKFYIVLIFINVYGLQSFANPSNWAQPDALCVEDVAPAVKAHAAQAQNYLLRSKINRDSDDYDFNLLTLHASDQLNGKINAIYKAANEVEMPPQILLGALMQESNLSNDGLDYDNGNYSCGIAQINLAEWCLWAESLTPIEQKKIQWPESLIKNSNFSKIEVCNSQIADRVAVAPFANYSFTRFKTKYKRLHRVPPQIISDLEYNQVESQLTGQNPQERRLNYEMIRSFLKNCGDHGSSIYAMAFILKSLYDKNVPQELKETEFYKSKESFNKKCIHKVKSKAFPYNTGWLMAVAMYNAGEQILPGVIKYKNKDWSDFRPDDLIQTLSYIPTTGDLFGKTVGDWDIVTKYVIGVINNSAPKGRPLIVLNY